jgi:hypothetical protein
MVNIAEFAIAYDRETRQIYPDCDEVWSWRDGRTRVSSICSQIRSVVLSAQRLWAYVDLSQSSEWNELCMERARMVPFAVFYEEAGEEMRATDAGGGGGTRRDRRWVSPSKSYSHKPRGSSFMFRGHTQSIPTSK